MFSIRDESIETGRLGGMKVEKEFSNEPMLDIFIYETTQNIEQLEELILASERESCFTKNAVDEIFRIMHTIKGSAAMMMYNNIASVAHSMEDLFYYVRDEHPRNMNCELLSDLFFEGVDFIKLELEKVKNRDELDGDPTELIESIRQFLNALKGGNSAAAAENVAAEEGGTGSCCIQADSLALPAKGADDSRKDYEVTIFFEADCEMENIRAFSILHNLEDITEEFTYFPADILDNSETVQFIRETGFHILLRTERSIQDLHEFFAKTAFVRDFEVAEHSGAPEAETKQALPDMEQAPGAAPKKAKAQLEQVQSENKNSHQNIISVDVTKLDKLMDLMGEMVIAEAMVTQNPELEALQLNSFYKAARQLRKITDELQDMIMSIRMVPLSSSFHKMHRIVRDMSRKLEKEVELILVGEETEVDKNIIEHISDPLMHLVRNAVDHGIESAEERKAAGKPEKGQITLEAKNAGGDVLIIVRDDGAGINREKVLKKAAEQGLLNKPESELTDKEIYNMIFHPGFSTNENVTEFSGRGVGMDVVVKNLEAVGGAASVDSAAGVGTVTTLQIPLTLTIIDGMNIRVGNAKYTLPTISIRETFQAKPSDLLKDPEGNELIMVRGECYPVLRLHELFGVQTEVTDLTQGIMLMIEQNEKCISLFADELLGQHQVVVKALPSYMKNLRSVERLAGCTLLGDGSISLILNIGGLANLR